MNAAPRAAASRLTEARRSFAHVVRAVGLVARSSRPLTIGLAAMTLAAALVPPGTAWAGKRIVDAVIARRQDETARWVLVELGLVAMQALLQRGLALVSQLLGLRLGIDVNVAILEKAVGLGLPAFEDSEFYDKMTRARREASTRPLQLVRESFGLVQSALTLAGYAALLLRFSAWAVAALLVATVPATLAEMRASRQTFQLRNRRSQEWRRLTYLEHVLANDEHAKEVKLFQLGPPLLTRYRRLAAQLFDEDRRVAIRRTLGQLLSLLATTAFYGAYWVMARAAAAGRITVGNLTLYVVAFRQGQQAFQSLLASVGSIYEQNLYMSNLFEFLDAPSASGPPEPAGFAPAAPPSASPLASPAASPLASPTTSPTTSGAAAALTARAAPATVLEPTPPEPPASPLRPYAPEPPTSAIESPATEPATSPLRPNAPEPPTSAIEGPAAEPAARLVFEDVSFRYPGRGDWAIRNLSLIVARGSSLALVGDNGAGKTTIVKLLTGLYRPTEGRIRLDGRDLRDWDEEALRARFGVVFQDFNQYQLTARDNVGLGSVPHLWDDARIARAAEEGGAAEIVASLPRGLDTSLGNWFRDGTELSGGQWQKIALSRGFMREEADILVLDEPTAALDADSEHHVFERFRALSRGRTTIVISHRFPTVRMADRIVVLHHGAIVEQGTHDELVAARGRYAHMFELQARGYR